MTTAMTSRTTMLLDYLHYARAAEQRFADQASRQMTGLPDSDYRRLVAAQATQTRQRMHDLDARMAALGESRGRLSATAEVMRQLADDALEVSSAAVAAGLDVVRRHPIETTLVDLAREQAAATAFARTTHAALAEAARTVDDPATAELAIACRTELTEFLTELDSMMPALVAAALETADLRPSYRQAATAATRRVREAASNLGEDAEHVQHELRDTLDELWRRARRAPINPPTGKARDTRANPVADKTDLPIADYTRLASTQIISRLPQLTPDQLTAVESFERTHAARVTILNKIQSLRRKGTGTHP